MKEKEVKALVENENPEFDVSDEPWYDDILPSNINLKIVDDDLGSNSDLPEFKFDEDALIEELYDYVCGTYDSHYSGEKYQATDLIIDAGHGTGFCIGNIIKYTKRYGKKNGYDETDIFKMLHYSLILLHVHRKEHNGN